MKRRIDKAAGIVKLTTGIPGLDAMTNGGLPANSVTLVVGPTGAGKTVLALQILAHNACKGGSTGIFVAFEECKDKILANGASFGWDLPRLLRRKLLMIDARLPQEAVQAGSFEITGLLATISAYAKTMNARWVVFDAIDVLLDLLPDPKLRRREVERLRLWLEENRLTAILTAKEEAVAPGAGSAHAYIAYMVECVIHLQRRNLADLTTRWLSVEKYRGSAHGDSAVVFLIGPRGFELHPLRQRSDGYKIYTHRISTGVPRLDGMLRGGLIRGSATLVSGAPGTSKTTLASKFAEAVCMRGERVLYVCFDEAGNEIVRNVASVGIRLAPFVRNGRLRMAGIISGARSADALVADILAQIVESQPHALVLDPLSALLKQGSETRASDVAYRIVQHCKMRGITVFATSLVGKSIPDSETTELHVSTLADTWIHLSYVVRGGERNRTLTIVKSRGTGHSNQVRELILSDGSVTLADVFVEDGEVLIGTLRDQREAAAGRGRQRQEDARTRARLQQQQALDDLSTKIRLQQNDLERRTREMALDSQRDESTTASQVEQRARTSRLRRADKPVARRRPR